VTGLNTLMNIHIKNVNIQNKNINIHIKYINFLQLSFLLHDVHNTEILHNIDNNINIP
jgi:hypothetical protein